jgi:hypothetical protein
LSQPISFGPTRGKYSTSEAQQMKEISFSGQTSGGVSQTLSRFSSAATANSANRFGKSGLA